MNYLLINDQLDVFKASLNTTRKEHFTRLIEQCRMYEGEVLSKAPPPTSITYMGMAAANLSLAYLLTEQDIIWRKPNAGFLQRWTMMFGDMVF